MTHAKWTIGVLMLIIIGLVTVVVNFQVIGKETIINVASLFSTLLSIVLSLIAIYYSFSTSKSTERQLNEVSACVTKMEEITNGIKNQINMIMSTVIRINATVKSTDNMIQNQRRNFSNKSIKSKDSNIKSHVRKSEFDNDNQDLQTNSFKPNGISN